MSGGPRVFPEFVHQVESFARRIDSRSADPDIEIISTRAARVLTIARDQQNMKRRKSLRRGGSHAALAGEHGEEA
jgi:hypothetical protein